MSDLIDRQAAIDVLDVLCQEHRYKIPGKVETYSQYNEAWQDALGRAEVIIGNLPSVQPEVIRCKDCRYYKTYQYVNGIRKFLPKCSFNDIYVAEEDFCSQAERRQNG